MVMRALGRFQSAVIALSGLVFAVLAATAAAAEPASYELPDATHAGPLAIAKDGTAWFVPSRGTEWKGHDYSIVASLAPDGTVSEHEIAGFSTINGIAISPKDALWVSGYDERNDHHKIFEIGRLSSTGNLLRLYTVGGGHPSAGRRHRDGRRRAGQDPVGERFRQRSLVDTRTPLPAAYFREHQAHQHPLGEGAAFPAPTQMPCLRTCSRSRRHAMVHGEMRRLCR